MRADEPPDSRAAGDQWVARVDWRAMDEQTRASKLTRCRDCDGVISRRADRCPHCGAPRYRWGAIAAALIVIIAVWALILLLLHSCNAAG